MLIFIFYVTEVTKLYSIIGLISEKVSNLLIYLTCTPVILIDQTIGNSKVVCTINAIFTEVWGSGKCDP